MLLGTSRVPTPFMLRTIERGRAKQSAALVRPDARRRLRHVPRQRLGIRSGRAQLYVIPKHRRSGSGAYTQRTRWSELVALCLATLRCVAHIELVEVASDIVGAVSVWRASVRCPGRHTKLRRYAIKGTAVARAGLAAATAKACAPALIGANDAGRRSDVGRGSARPRWRRLHLLSRERVDGGLNESEL